MRSQRINHGLVITAATAAFLLSGCGAATGQSQNTGTSTPSASATTSASSAAPAPASSAPSSAAATQAGPALCKAANLKGSTDAAGGGAAGSVYMELIMTNSGAEPCLLKGFAGVSLTADANGEPIGAPASRDESTPVADVLLAPGKAGTATLRYTQAGNFPDCAKTPAAGFRIYPPEDTASLFVADPRDACDNTGIDLLTIGAFQAK
ncbi:DUF4232 domain-containing protein [Arthrobacter sp. UYCu712]|uniref:DUF4232 domain-containing protein n=1 Tax=Arthrobacter sp. UYCu712 TaxID=3156340 RepID=UPI0033928BB9